MTKENRFFIKMFILAGGSLFVHYLILWITKTDEPFLFLLAFGSAAAAITSWIFETIAKKRKGN
jgi:hypothetical protein